MWSEATLYRSTEFHGEQYLKGGEMKYRYMKKEKFRENLWRLFSFKYLNLYAEGSNDYNLRIKLYFPVS
jgi:hypothetical protein